VAEAGRLQGEPPAAGAHDARAARRCAERCTTCRCAAPRIRNRLPKQQARTQVRSIRLSPSELAAVAAAARASRMTTAGFAAQAAVTAARDTEHAAARIADDRATLVELFAARRHLRQVGNNLNQIARVLNSGGNPPHTSEALAAVEAAVTRVDAAVRRVLDSR
jgi:hypothetical protein